MSKFFVFDNVLDPEQKHCLYLNNETSFISERKSKFKPICNHEFRNVNELMNWYATEWSTEMKTLCPICKKGNGNGNGNKKKVLIAVPHATCQTLTVYEKNGHYCDFFAQETAQMFDTEFKKRGYQTILFDNARKRTEYDENRPQNFDSQMRKQIKSALTNENLAFALEVHSYPPTDDLTKDLDFYGLDNFMDQENPVSNRVETFMQLSVNDEIKIGLLQGDKTKNYLQNLFRKHRLDSFLLEANEKNQSEGSNEQQQQRVAKLTENIIRVFIE